MPEIMSQNIFPTMRENCDVPILPLIMDEQTGKAGYLTRLEAFVDLMRRRKRKLALDKKNSLLIVIILRLNLQQNNRIFNKRIINIYV